MSSISVTYSGPVNGQWTMQLDASPVGQDTFGFNLAASRTILALNGPGGSIQYDYPTSPGPPPKITWFSQSRVTAQMTFNPAGIPFTLKGTTGTPGVADGSYTPPQLPRPVPGITTPKNTAVAITLTMKSPADLCAPYTFTVVSNPTHGVLTGTAPNLTYTPNAGFTGVDSFTYKATGCSTDSTTETVTILVGGPTPPCGW